MILLKYLVIEAIKRMPDNVTIDDIIKEIIVVDEMFERMKASEDGNNLTIEKVLQRADKCKTNQEFMTAVSKRYFELRRNYDVSKLSQNTKETVKRIKKQYRVK